MKGVSVKCLVLSVVLLAGCASPPQKMIEEMTAEENGESLPGTVLLYIITEAGDDQSYTARMFVNANYLHMADSRAPMDYILFDRKAKVIYSVNADDKTVFEIHAKPINIEPPIRIDYVEESQPSSAIPKIQGRHATHYRYTVNGERCYDAVVTPPSFLPEVRETLIEFQAILAGEHASTLANTPRDMLDACDLAVHVFDARRHYAHGLPIREWGADGYQRFLKDYQGDFSVLQEVLSLPEDYRHYSLDNPLPASKETRETSAGS